LEHIGRPLRAARGRLGPSLVAFAALAVSAAARLPAEDALAATACLDVSVSSLGPAVESAEVIVIGTVVDVSPRARVAIRPEAYLEGPAEAADIVLPWPNPLPQCPLADFSAGERVLVFLDQGPRGLEWPGAEDAFVLRDGTAATKGPRPAELPEAALVGQVRELTGQYAVPSAGDGAGIDPVATVLPVAAAVLGLFAIGLVLMRIWHRIDPS